jgi:succinylglutamate desuccinylase
MQEIGNHIWQVSAQADGPRVVVIGGMHGNELTGIEVVKALMADFDSGAATLQRGTLTIMIGNPKAIERGTRGSEDHADLNRMFNPDRLAGGPDGTYEDARAREMAPYLRKADVSIDLHSTNKPSEPFIASRVDARHEAIYRWFDTTKVVGDTTYAVGGGAPATSDDIVDLSGGVGVAYESGQAADTSRIAVVKGCVENILRDLGLFSGQPTNPPYDVSEKYDMAEAVILTDAGWRFAEQLGNRSFEPVKRGDVLGWHGEEPHMSPVDGVLLFPKVKEHWKVGKPVCFLAKMAK